MTRANALCALFLVILTGAGWPASPPARQQSCSDSALDQRQRQRCDEEAFRQAAKSITTPLDGGWQLVKTRDPAGGAEAVSVMHVVDSSKSDFALAGLSLQCGHSGVEVVLIILDRLPRVARPTVVFTAGTKQSEFEASVVQGGEALLLPETASKLADGEWQSTNELSVDIETKSASIRGRIPIGGLSAALRHLSQNCPAQ